MNNQVVELNDFEVSQKRASLMVHEQNVLDWEHQVNDLQARLDCKIDQRFAERNLKLAEENLKVGKILEPIFEEDVQDKILDDLEKENLKLRIESQKRFIESEIPLKRLRAEIADLNKKINFTRDFQISPLKKQIKTKKILATQ